ncbi:MAG: MoaD/ThiS family protein [Syntrophobacteraceae bacterium]
MIKVNVKLPSAFAALAGGKKMMQVSLEEQAILEVLLDLLAAEYPDLKQRAGIGRGVIPDHVNVYHNGENVRYLQGVKTPLTEGDTVQIIPAEAAG